MIKQVRHLILALGAVVFGALTPAGATQTEATAPMRTQWVLSQSSGLDAVAFLGPLSGDPFYARFYGPEIAAFGPKLPADFQSRAAKLEADAKAQHILLTPILDLILSGASDTSLDGLIVALGDPEHRLRPSFAADANWDAKQWAWFAGVAPQVRQALEDMRAAGFVGWWHEVFDPIAAKREPEVRKFLAKYDIVGTEEKLTGRHFNPAINIIFLEFVKPHGVRVQGQTFVTSFDYPDTVIVANAAHELLHPPLDMDGAVAKRLMAIVAGDPVLSRTISEHDPAFGYTTVSGVVNEDLVQALEQATCDKLNCGQSAVYRWNHADDGMHILAAGMYGIMNERAYPATGGNFETWLGEAMKRGWVTGQTIRQSAARVLGRPSNALWPAPK